MGYTSYLYRLQRITERDDITAVDVCLHNNLHMPVTLDAFRRVSMYTVKTYSRPIRRGAIMVEAANNTAKCSISS